MGHGLGGVLGEFLRIDTDRKYRDARCAVTRRYHPVFDRETEIR